MHVSLYLLIRRRSIFQIKNVCGRIRSCSCTFTHTKRSTLNKTGVLRGTDTIWFRGMSSFA